MKALLPLLLLSLSTYAQSVSPHNAPGNNGSERISNFTVGDAGNDRIEIANGTLDPGKFIPTVWSYRDTDNTFSLVFTSSISTSVDNGTSPVMLFTTTIPSRIDLNTPASGNFVWGAPGSSGAVINRPLFEWRNGSSKLMTIVANGNVGIGTNIPTARFHTSGSVRFENLINATTPDFMLGTDSNGNVYKYPVPSGGGGSGTADADWLKPDGSVPMSINDTKYTNGLIGFSTQNPTANLHANGTVRFQNLGNATTPDFMLGTDANGNVFEYPVPVSGSGIADADWLKPDGSVPMLIGDTKYTNGLVGFNTSSPTANLHTDGTVRFQNLGVGSAPNFVLGTDSDGNVLKFPPLTGGVSTADADWLKPDGSVPMLIGDTKYTNGLVGFNTSSPTANLHTDGTVRFQNLSNATTPDFMLGTDANGNVFEYPAPVSGSGIADADWLKLDDTVPMSVNDNIYKNGKVAINTNVIPVRSGSEDVRDYSLFVKGGILTEEVRVSLANEWADYVFKKGYELQTLQQVEEQIIKEGHLKNIPASDEVKNNGIELGEMNKLLLEKIEELTLYVIDLNKKLDKQQSEIDRLKKGN